jgi:hypothetical protein
MRSFENFMEYFLDRHSINGKVSNNMGQGCT